MSEGEGRPEWAQRIRGEREVRGWSVPHASEQLRQTALAAGERQVPEKDSVLRSWKRWEAGGGISETWQRYMATLFGTVRKAMFAPPREPSTLPTGMDVLELVERMQSSSIDPATLTSMGITVDRLCSDYPHSRADDLIIEARQWLARVVQLRNHPMTLTQQREVLTLGGWLALLVGCLYYDLGDRQSSESTRLAALSLGHESDNIEIQGWAHEMSAWQALTQGNYRGVLTASEAGAAVAGEHGVAVQLATQAAKAHARLGQAREAGDALERGRRLLEPMPYPSNLDNHFVVDPGKFDFYAMDVHKLAGENNLAEHLAHEILASGTAWDGTERSPMRNAEARITLGTVAARRGDIDGAVLHGEQALEGDRKSLPSLLMNSRELASTIRNISPDAPAGRDYIERLRTLSVE